MLPPVVVLAPPKKAPMQSRTIRFNAASGLLAVGVLPFLPEGFAHRPGAVEAVAAWFSLGNIALRFITATALCRPAWWQRLVGRRAVGDGQEDQAG